MPKVVFMGTPEFAVPSLNALVESGIDVIAAFTQPDRPSGRGHKLQACPVKTRCMELNIPVYQFERVRGQKGLDTMRELKPDLIVTAAFGQILSQKLLDVPEYGVMNVHASILPKHRGAAPINWCIINGDAETGVTIMLTDRGVDTGDILTCEKTPIRDTETAGELTERLSVIGGELLKATIFKYLNGEISPVRQDESRMTHEPMLSKEMGLIDWTKSAKEISCLVRGLTPWPNAYTAYGESAIKVFGVQPVDYSGQEPCGTIIEASPKSGLVVKCSGGAVYISDMQAANAKRMSSNNYLMGKTMLIGAILGAKEQ